MSDLLGFPVTQHNGQAATLADLAPLAFAGYAHFTAMQVRGGQVRGLDLHLARLHAASLEMFGQALPDAVILDALRNAIRASAPDLSLVATMVSRAGEFVVADEHEPLDVLVRTSPPASGPAGPLSLAAFEHERMLPSVKHVGEVAKTYLLRQAVAQGHDDAAFVDRQGRLSEASIWNLAFWDGSAVVWPDAAMLTGTTLGIVQRQLEKMGVPQRRQAVTLDTLPGLAGAAVMNSWTPGIAVRRIGDTAMPDAPRFLALLHAAYQAEMPVSV
ncbi:MAG: branched-chain amino acid aminotransferase [Achromobacter sp.]|uniref:aminotransferase class IV family protein n=1 Tax=Achromobacter sp. TaxID=134375 RepID=UPI0012C550A9|nr:aminotransferase class IV family protein [Achromobacter sp.]MPS78824.1 branched-chain amino acid aminotransferase [Achromobacter sp.]